MTDAGPSGARRREGYQRVRGPLPALDRGCRADDPHLARAGFALARELSAARALVDVAVRDRDLDALVAAVALREVLGDRDRPVAPARAADRDHEVRLALGDVLRQQEVEQREQALVQLAEAPVAGDVFDHALVQTG